MKTTAFSICLSLATVFLRESAATFLEPTKSVYRGQVGHALVIPCKVTTDPVNEGFEVLYWMVDGKLVGEDPRITVSTKLNVTERDGSTTLRKDLILSNITPKDFAVEYKCKFDTPTSNIEKRVSVQKTASKFRRALKAHKK